MTFRKKTFANFANLQYLCESLIPRNVTVGVACNFYSFKSFYSRKSCYEESENEDGDSDWEWKHERGAFNVFIVIELLLIFVV